MEKVVLLIPAYNPRVTLSYLVDECHRMGFQDIVVVNDGSDPTSHSLFKALREKCVVLTHPVNLGKGRALKTGLNHIYINYPYARGVVTVDADGQHHPEDVKSVADSLKKTTGRTIIIGQRNIHGKMPLRSLIGNVITRYVFYLLLKKKLRDTQCGLRGLPRAIIPEFLDLEGERYDYEMNMLIHAGTRSIGIQEIAIKTIYNEQNRSSHFDPVFDSMRIYFLFLRFVSFSLRKNVLRIYRLKRMA